MRAQAQKLVELAQGLKAEIQKMDYFDGSRIEITDEIHMYANDAREFIHVEFNKNKGKTVDVSLHEYSSLKSDVLNIDMSVSDEELDAIVERSKDVVEKFIYIYKNIVDELKDQRIAELELEIAKLRGDVSVS